MKMRFSPCPLAQGVFANNRFSGGVNNHFSGGVKGLTHQFIE
jgi:hypothetical protein